MIPVETVLRRLIVEFEFVILPGFGALLCHHIPASYDADSGVFSPSMKKLAFNEFLKLDDGLLANFISRHEQIPHQDAVGYIKDYIEKLWSRLEAQGEARIAGIGVFSKNVEGKLVFDPGKESHFKDEWYGFKSVSARLATSINRPRVVTVRENEYVEEGIEILEEETGSGTKWWRWAAAAAVVGIVGYFSVFFVSGNLENQSTLNPFAELFANPSSRLEAQPSAVDVAPVLSIAQGDAIVPTDSEKDFVIVEEAKPADQAEALAHTEVHTQGDFYVIAGAFKGSRQAGVLLQQLKEKGFENTILLPADVSNSKVKVAIASYTSEGEAYEASRKLKDVIGEVGWVFKKTSSD
jgi:cell division septation protein DedD